MAFKKGNHAAPKHAATSQDTDRSGGFKPAVDIDSLSQTASVQQAGTKAYSRHANGKYQHPKRRRRRIVLTVLGCIFAVLLVGGGVAWAYLHHTVEVVDANLKEGLDENLQDSLVKTDLTNEPFYMLLLGTDESLQRQENLETGGTYRTDSIILARIDAKAKQVTMVSVPRDTKIELDGHGVQKINAAYAFGGSSLAVDTISSVAGVGISHFALVDMDGLKATVDALGGVEVDVPIEINDPDAGGHLDAGLQTLDGDQALILCRARHAYDSYGDGDGYRAADQRLVLQAIAKKMLASDPITLTNTITLLSEYVHTDLSVNDIIGLAQAMRGMDPSTSLWSATLPTEAVYEDKVWYNIILEKPWKAMMDRVNAGLSPTEETVIDEATGIAMSSAGDDAPSTEVDSGGSTVGDSSSSSGNTLSSSSPSSSSTSSGNTSSTRHSSNR